MKGFKRMHNQKGETTPKPIEHSTLAHIDMLASTPFLLALGRLCPSSKRPHSMCVHAKAKIRNQQTSNGRKGCKGYVKEA